MSQMQIMDRKLILLVLLYLFHGNEGEINATLCCPEGFGFDRFLKCKEIRQQKKDLFAEVFDHKNVTLNVLDGRFKVYTTYNAQYDMISLTEDTELYSEKHCLGVSDDGSRPFFFPYIETNVSYLNLSFYSCCETGQVLNAQDECQSSEFNYSLRVSLQVPGRSTLEFFELETADYESVAKKQNCSRTTRKYLHSHEEHCIRDSECVFPEFYVDDEGQLTMMNIDGINEIIPKESFCLAVNETGSTVARVCHDDSCKSGNCITKCCPSNKKMTMEEEGPYKILHCRPMETEAREFKMEVKTASGGRETKTLRNYKFRFGFPYCPKNTIQDLIDFERDQLRADMWFLSNGSLYFDRFDISQAFYVYCYDEVFDLEQYSKSRAFAVLCLEQRSEEPPSSHHKLQGAAMIISSFFYALTILAHLLLPPLWNLQGLTVVSQSLSLMLNFLVLSYVKIKTMQFGEDDAKCRALALSAYYFFEAGFVWLAVMSYDVYFPLGGSTSGKQKRKCRAKAAGLYSLIGWGIPATLLLIADLIDKSHDSLPHYVLRPYFGVLSCWFYSNKKIISAYLYGPASIFLLINIMFFAIIARKLYVASGRSFKLAQDNKGKERLCAIFKLFVLMGLTWIFEIISFLVGGDVYYWYFTDFLNIFLSVLVFILFICKKRTLDFIGLQYDCVGKVLRRRFAWEPSTSAANFTSRYSKKNKLAEVSNSATVETVFAKTSSGKFHSTANSLNLRRPKE